MVARPAATEGSRPLVTQLERQQTGVAGPWTVLTCGTPATFS